MRWIALLLALINDLLADRARLALENAALRQQLTVLKRSVNRAKINDSHRVFWILIRRLLESWRDTLVVPRGWSAVTTVAARLNSGPHRGRI